MKGKTIKKNDLFMLLLIFPLIILAKWYQFNVLNGYAFGIINRIIEWLPTNIIPVDLSYAFPLRIYRLIRFLPLNTALEWAIFWAIVMNVIFFVLLISFKQQYKLEEYIFIYVSMFILDVFVFNINKDLIQCLIVLLIFFIIKKNGNSKVSLFLITIILFLESIFFRTYYILAVATILIVYYVLSSYLNRKPNKRKTIFAIIIVLLLLFSFIFISQYFNAENYNQLIGRRDTVEEDLDAVTVIADWIPGDGFFNYCLNYIINMFRMSFGLELLFKGVKYLPFIIYQIYLTINILKNIKKLNEQNMLNITFIVGYWLMLFASESDFGTLVRHQAILLPFYLKMIDENIRIKEVKKNAKD